MKSVSAAVLLALSAATPVFAATTLDFEAVPSFASIGAFYGAAGITFGGDAQGIANDTANFPAYYLGAPSPLGVLAAVGPDSALNAASGLAGSISFHYSSIAMVANGVQLWSGLDGTGTVLASFNLMANSSIGGCNGGNTSFCRFDMLSGTFGGIARSVTFDSTGVSAFDNVTVTVVPEPATYAMMVAGLGGLALAVRRRRS